MASGYACPGEGGEGDNIVRFRFRCGVIAMILLIVLFLLVFAIVIMESGAPSPDGPVDFARAVLLWITVLFVVFAAAWIVLMFTDIEQPDTLDRRTRWGIIAIAASLSFVSGLAFYSKFYIIMAFSVPLVSGFLADIYNRRRHSDSLVRMYNNLSSITGIMLGYIAATLLAWDELHSVSELEGNGFLGLDTDSRMYSLFRLGLLILIYIFLGELGKLGEGHRRSFTESLEGKESDSHIVVRTARNAALSAIIIAAVLLYFHFAGHPIGYCVVFGGPVLLLPLFLLWKYMQELTVLLER